LFYLTFLFLIFLSFSEAFAQTDICEILDMKSCAGISRQRRRSSAQSLPNASSAANLNPANVSFDRGIGVEAIQQAGNPTVFNLVSGTGRFGAALISTNMENSFFSNRAPELDPHYTKRHETDQQFRTKKQALSVGVGIIRQKRIGLDIGVVLKRNKEIGKLNTGFGASLRAWIFHFGASAYKDDTHLNLGNDQQHGSNIPYRFLLNQNPNKDSYEESYHVSTLSGGVKIGDLFVDYGTIRSKTKIFGQTTITFYSASYAYKNILLTAAMRKEESFMQQWEGGRIIDQKIHRTNYYSVQYSVARPLIIGLHYNFFLLNEVSVGATIFY
jgi:hypothetical protein